MFVNEIIRRSLRVIGVLAAGETVSAADQADALASLDGMLDSWRLERLTIPAVWRFVFPLVPNQGEYTIGAGGDLEVERGAPVTIEHAAILQDASVEPPIETPIAVYTDQAWKGITLKTLTNAWPQGLRYERDAPFGRITVFPTPTSASVSLVLYLPMPMEAPLGDVGIDLNLLPGYADALVYNLALRLAPEFGAPIRPEVVQLARDSLMVLKRVNVPMVELAIDRALAGPRGYDIWSDT